MRWRQLVELLNIYPLKCRAGEGAIEDCLMEMEFDEMDSPQWELARWRMN